MVFKRAESKTLIETRRDSRLKSRTKKSIEEYTQTAEKFSTIVIL